jgi:hypothetical protein
MAGAFRWVAKTAKQETSNAYNTVVAPVVKTAQSLVRSVNTVADNIIRNPLPTIETAVLISMGVPPIIASSAVTAANGGSMEQIALSAATAYASAEIGSAVGDEYSPIETETLKQLGPQYADEALIKQIIVSSSGSAAVTALKGGSFEQVLKASVSGAVDGYINKSLKDSGYNNVDSKIISSATSAATRAILNGQDVGTAIGNSVAATTLSTAISGKVDQINKNNEVGQGLYDNYTSLKGKATDYFNTKVDPAQAEEKQNYAAYVAARDEYTKIKDQFDAQYKIWSDNKDSNVDAANSAADAANALTPKLNTASSVLGTATDTFKNSSAVAQQYRDTYTAEYVNTINDINTKITNINKENTALATDLGPLVTKYEQQAAVDQSNIVKEVGASAVEEAQKVSEQQAKDVGFKTYADKQTAGDVTANEFYAQQAGFKNYSDQTAAKDLSPLDYYAQKAGFKSGADQQTALSLGIENPQDWIKYQVAQETAQWNSDRSATSYGFRDAADRKIANTAGFTDSYKWSQYQSLSDTAKQNYDTQVKGGMSPEEALNASVALDDLEGKGSATDMGTVTVTAPRDPYTGDVQYDLSGNLIKPTTPTTPTTTPTKTTTTGTTTGTTGTTTIPAVVAPLAGAATLASTATADPKLDTSAQYLGPPSSNLGQSTARLGKLIQLSDNPEEDQNTVDTSNLVDPMNYNPDLYKTKLMASGGSTSNLTPISNYDISLPYTTPNMLPPAPVVKQESRLGTLRNLFNSIGTQRIAHAAKGGLPAKYAEAAPKGHNPEFVTGLTGYYAQGKGTGQSDDIPAMLHDGDYVADADLVAALGDGSSKAGAEALEKFRRQIPHQQSAEGGAVVPAKIADGEYVFPASFVTAIGQGDNKAGAKLLDAMRKEIRAHKRSAPTSKIPPKAKSPLDYLKMVKG